MMNSQPWLTYFKNSVGQPLIFSPQNSAVVINEKSKQPVSGQKSDLPIDVISPLEQNNRMAIAEMKEAKKDGIMKGTAVVKKRSQGKDARTKQVAGSSKKPRQSHTTKIDKPKRQTSKKKKSSKKSATNTNSKTGALGDKAVIKKLTVTGRRAKDIFSKVSK